MLINNINIIIDNNKLITITTIIMIRYFFTNDLWNS